MGHRSVVFGICLAFGASAAAAADIEMEAVGKKQTIQCQGQSVEINGSGNTLTLQGECPDVEVNGTSQTVYIEIAGAIEVSGVGNKVFWGKALKGDRPSIDKTGINNTVEQGDVGAEGSGQAEAGAALRSVGGGITSILETAKSSAGLATSVGDGDEIVVNDNAADRTIQCDGETVRVNGNRNTLRIRGECGKVAVMGNLNVLDVEAAGVISTVGTGNEVVWTRGTGEKDPKVSDIGTNNTIRKTDR
jgi:hypothetical protein